MMTVEQPPCEVLVALQQAACSAACLHLACFVLKRMSAHATDAVHALVSSYIFTMPQLPPPPGLGGV
jgi:hypothetical protein